VVIFSSLDIFLSLACSNKADFLTEFHIVPSVPFRFIAFIIVFASVYSISY
jgi:hypothetical protein